MNYIESEEQYQVAMARIEELLPIVKEDTPEDDENYLELVKLSYMVQITKKRTILFKAFMSREDMEKIGLKSPRIVE